MKFSRYIFLLMVVSVAIITTTVLISYHHKTPLPNKKSAVFVLTQEAIRDLGDGFFTKERHGFVLVKFPSRYLDTEDHFKQGFATALFKLYGSIYENVKVSIGDDLITGTGKGDAKIVAEALFLTDSDKTVVGVVFPKP